MVTRKNSALNVLMNGILIGTLEKTSAGLLIFTYDKKWLGTSDARPISLSMPLVEKPYTGDIVYNFFDNLLPDNTQIRARIQAKFHIPTNQPFDLLKTIGKDCAGAIQLVHGEMPIFNKTIHAEPLTEKEIASILHGYRNNPLGMRDTAEFRISIAGAQEKSAFLYHKKSWCIPIGETPTTHIFKLPIGFIAHQNIDLSDSCENEWLCLHIAEAFGLPTAKSRILEFEDVKALVVERFDRKMSRDKSWLMRLPQEDMCQALGISSNLKYQSDGGPGINNIMDLLLGSINPAAGRDMFYRAQILFWLLAAIDGHAKNFSIFIEPQGKYRLTPFYDILSAYPLIEKKQLQIQKIKMAMALTGKNKHYHWHNIQRRHFLETAKSVKYSVEKAEMILEEMLENIDFVITKVAEKLPINFPSNIAEPIFEGMRRARERLK